MKRTPVHSTSIASIGYDPADHTMEIEYRQSGDVYLYFGVSATERTEFMAAESKGTYLNYIFKLKGHDYVVLRKGNGQESCPL